MSTGNYYCKGNPEAQEYVYSLPGVWWNIERATRDHTPWDEEQLAKIFIQENPDRITIHFLCAITGMRMAIHVTPEYVKALP